MRAEVRDELGDLWRGAINPLMSIPRLFMTRTALGCSGFG